MKGKKGPIVLGIGTILITGLLLLFRKKKPPLPEAPPNGIVVGLWDPPSEATAWLMNILDYSISDYQTSGSLGIGEPAIFVVEQSWFPLRIEIWMKDAGGAVLHSIQSFMLDAPDYTEIYIPDYGSYYYNVAKERFEEA